MEREQLQQLSGHNRAMNEENVRISNSQSEKGAENHNYFRTQIEQCEHI
jgi:hypothetical protein